MKNNLFRKVSLERLSSPERLEQMVSVVTPRWWLALGGFLILLVVFILWLIFGRIPVAVQGTGILLNQGGIKNISYTQSAYITDILVSEGDYIKKGQAVAKISKPDILDKIIYKQLNIDELKKKNSSSVKVEIDKLEQEVTILQEELEYQSTIFSAFSGRIIEVKVGIGESISAGQSIASIEEKDGSSNKLCGLMYISVKQSDKIQEGMQVKIYPNFMENHEYGFLKGTVKKVSSYPVTKEGVKQKLGSDELAENFFEGIIPIEVKVELIKDDKMFSGYQWSTKAGPKIKINSGTLWSGEIVISNVKPINLIIPF